MIAGASKVSIPSWREQLATWRFHWPLWGWVWLQSVSAQWCLGNSPGALCTTVIQMPCDSLKSCVCYSWGSLHLLGKLQDLYEQELIFHFWKETKVWKFRKVAYICLTFRQTWGVLRWSWIFSPLCFLSYSSSLPWREESGESRETAAVLSWWGYPASHSAAQPNLPGETWPPASF